MRARIAFDTLAFANRLKAAGVEPKIAEAQAEANADMIAGLLDETLATKADLAETKAELKSDIANLKQSMKDLELRLTMRLGGIVLGGLTIVTAILSTLRVIH